jgi:RNA polymerase sigma factor (sigma-70 family)
MCDASRASPQLVDVTIKTALAPPAARSGGPSNPRAAARDPVAEFERIYRDNVDVVTAFFARRATEPQAVADLTADTFVAAITSLATFDPGKGTARAWLLGIARRVFAAHCESLSRHQDRVSRLAGRRDLEADQIEELEAKIDAQRAARQLLQALATLPETDRVAVELVDVVGLKPGEAAAALGIAAGTLRMRLMRARARLRKEASGTVAKKSPEGTRKERS